jgi:hypothetical protein
MLQVRYGKQKKGFISFNVNVILYIYKNFGKQFVRSAASGKRSYTGSERHNLACVRSLCVCVRFVEKSKHSYWACVRSHFVCACILGKSRGSYLACVHSHCACV